VVAEVGHRLEEQGLRRAGRQRDGLRHVGAGHVDDEDAGARLRPLVRGLVVAHGDADRALRVALQLVVVGRVGEFAQAGAVGPDGVEVCVVERSDAAVAAGEGEFLAVGPPREVVDARAFEGVRVRPEPPVVRAVRLDEANLRAAADVGDGAAARRGRR
jgi:hypothetical protein